MRSTGVVETGMPAYLLAAYPLLCFFNAYDEESAIPLNDSMGPLYISLSMVEFFSKGVGKGIRQEESLMY